MLTSMETATTQAAARSKSVLFLSICLFTLQVSRKLFFWSSINQASDFFCCVCQKNLLPDRKGMSRRDAGRLGGLLARNGGRIL